MHILVTGSTGRVGSRFVPRLLQRGNTVRVLVRQAERAEAHRRLGAEVIIGDLQEPATLTKAVTGVDAIVHLAAFFRGATDEQAQVVNEQGTLALADAAVQAGVPRFVFASTNLVYGTGNTQPSREHDEPRPVFTYPKTKLAAEEALRELHRTHGLGLRILRLAFVYGESDPHLPEWLPQLHNWHPAKRIHMVHHADVGQALLLAMHIPGTDGRTYNVADDAPITAAELLRLHNPVEAPHAEKPSSFDPWEMIVDTLRIRDELGFRPLYPSYYSARDAGAL